MPSYIVTEHVPHHKDKQWMENAVAEGKSSRTIAKELHISYKLVEMKLKEFGIPFTPYKSL